MQQAFWYYLSDGETLGPISSQELLRLHRDGTIAPETLVWTDGLVEWVAWRDALAAAGDRIPEVPPEPVQPAREQAGAGTPSSGETGSAEGAAEAGVSRPGDPLRQPGGGERRARSLRRVVVLAGLALAGLALAGVLVLYAGGAMLLSDRQGAQPTSGPGEPPVTVTENPAGGEDVGPNTDGAGQPRSAVVDGSVPTNGGGSQPANQPDGSRSLDTDRDAAQAEVGEPAPGEAAMPAGETLPASPAPADPPGGVAVTEAEAEALIGGSDDFDAHEEVFLATSMDLLRSGRCTITDFIEMGGWYKSSTRTNIYFTFCGGVALPNRIDLDVSSGTVIR